MITISFDYLNVQFYCMFQIDLVTFIFPDRLRRRFRLHVRVRVHSHFRFRLYLVHGR